MFLLPENELFVSTVGTDFAMLQCFTVAQKEQTKNKPNIVMKYQVA